MKLDLKKFPQIARLRAPLDASEARYNRLVCANGMASVLCAAAAEKRAMTESEIEAHDELASMIESLDEFIENRERSEQRSVGRPPLSLIDGQEERSETAIEKEKRRAFKNYLRSGFNGERFGLPPLSEEDRSLLRFDAERRDMGVGSPTASIPTSVLVPQGFFNGIETALKYYGPMVDVATTIDTATGAPMPYPTANDTAVSAVIVGEGQQVADVDLTVANIILNAWKFSTDMVKVSLELLQDSFFDLESYLQGRFAERLGRGLNTFFTNGTGTSQPTGFTAAVANAGVTPVTAVGSSGNTGGSETGGTSIGTDDLVALEHALDPWYRTGAIYQMHDSTLKRLKQLKDKYGRPIYESPKDGQPALLNGYPFRVNNDLPVIADNAKTVYFGRFDKYYVRRVKEMAVLRLVERFADYGQIAFIGFARYDGNLIDAGTHPVQVLQQASS